MSLEGETMLKALTLSNFILNSYEIDDMNIVLEVSKAKQEFALSTNHTVLKPQLIEGIHFNVIRHKRTFNRMYFYRVSFIMFDTIHYSYFLGNNLRELTKKLGETN